MTSEIDEIQVTMIQEEEDDDNFHLELSSDDD
jgi:hypothetical protein